MNWTSTEHSRNVHRLSLTLDDTKDEGWVLLQSDVHWDSPHCDRDKLKRHLDLALKRNAPVLDFGDFFDVMQGPGDRRGAKSELRSELKHNNYFDKVIQQASEYLHPYRHLLAVRGKGNHETSVTKFYATDLTERLVERLRVAGSTSIHLGGYSGYVRIQVMASKRSNAMNGWKLHYHHGAGGGGPVTRGVIQTNRQAVYLADADIVVNGHTHDSFYVPIQRVQLNAQNVIEHTRQSHIRCAGYKEEYGDGAGGWHIEKWGPPKPTGAYWLRFHVSDSHAGTVDYEVIEAR